MAPKDQIPDGSRMIVDVRGRSIGVFNVGGTFYALLNRCPHQGAQLCLGPVAPLMEADAPGRVRFDNSRHLLSCPWHHWEYDIATGQSYTDPASTRVRSYAVSVEDGDRVTHAIQEGQATADDVEPRGVASGGPSSIAQSINRVPGPFKAETFAVSVEDDYVVLELP